MRQWLRIAFPKNYLDRRKRAGFLFVLPALLFFGSVFILPLAQSIMYSFYKIAPGGARECGRQLLRHHTALVRETRSRSRREPGNDRDGVRSIGA